MIFLPEYGFLLNWRKKNDTLSTILKIQETTTASSSSLTPIYVNVLRLKKLMKTLIMIKFILQVT